MLPLVLLGLGSLLAWSAWGFVLWRFDPFSAGWIATLLFYFSLGIALAGTLIEGGIIWHLHRRGLAASRTEVGIIARQSFIIVAFVIVVLIIAANRLLKWWNITPLVMLTIALELFFMSLHRKSYLRKTSYVSKQTLR